MDEKDLKDDKDLIIYWIKQMQISQKYAQRIIKELEEQEEDLTSIEDKLKDTKDKLKSAEPKIKELDLLCCRWPLSRSEYRAAVRKAEKAVSDLTTEIRLVSG